QVAPVSTPIPQGGDMSFDECFQKCKQYTTRTNEQCFDACSNRQAAGASLPPNQVGDPGATRHGQLGSTCASGRDCEGVLICTDGRCATTSTAPQGWHGRQKGSPCDSSAQCAGDLLCVSDRCTEYKK